MRNLNPDSTYYIDADGKGLNWKGWNDQYNSTKKNYIKTSNAKEIEEIIKRISNDRPKFKVIVIDTINAIMIDDEFKRAKEKNFDKWMDLAASVYNLVSAAHNLRPDLSIVFTGHTQTEYDDSGYKFTRMKTNGRKLDKIVLESKFNTVLLAKGNDGKYVFETHAKDSTAKTPMDSFTDCEIPNDIAAVLKVLSDY